MMEPTKDGFWRERVRLGAGKREWVTVPVKREPHAEERFARIRVAAKGLVESGKQAEAPKLIADLARVAADPRAFAGVERAIRDLCLQVSGALEKPMTVRELCHLYTSGELMRRHPDYVDKKGKSDQTRERERARLSLLCETIGDIAVADLTLADADRAMLKVPAGRSDGWRYAHKQPLYHLMGIAAYPMQLIEANPIPSKWVGTLGKSAATPVLYPKEEAALNSNADLELEDRALWGIQAREGFRPSGIGFLRWADLDLDNGTVTHANKTDESRFWDLAEDVWRVLVYLAGLVSRDAEFVFPSVGRNPARLKSAAKRFQEALKASDLDRADLHRDNTRLRRKIRAHDLRTTFVTMALANGRPEHWVMARTGHTTSGQLMRYKRLAQSLESLNLGWFAPLDEVLGVAQRVGQKRISPEENAMLATTRSSSLGASGRPRVSKTPEIVTSPRLSAPQDVGQVGLGGPKPGPSPDDDGGTRAAAPGLSEDVLEELHGLATKARRWDLATAVAGQLEAIARGRDAGKVASLDRARRKRGGR